MSITKNLRKILAKADATHFEQGTAWYQNAHNTCKNIALRTNPDRLINTKIVCGVVAALSPQCSWPVNIRTAEDLILYNDTSGYTGYKSNISKANRMMFNDPVLKVLGAGTRYGAKVRAFFDNLLHPSTSELVTVDIHAIRAAYDIVDVPLGLIRAVFESKLNIEIQDAYRAVASEAGYRPCELQAIIWLVVKDNL